MLKEVSKSRANFRRSLGKSILTGPYIYLSQSGKNVTRLSCKYKCTNKLELCHLIPTGKDCPIAC